MQMFPYGWQLPDGTVMREAEYAGMAAAANASYWRWVNPDVQNAFLRQYARRPLDLRMTQTAKLLHML